MKPQLTNCCDRCKGMGDCRGTKRECDCHLPTLESESWEEQFEAVLPLIVEDYNNFIAEAGEIGELDIEEIWTDHMKPLIKSLLSAHHHSLIREISDKYGHFLEPTGDLSSNLSLKEVLTRLDK